MHLEFQRVGLASTTQRKLRFQVISQSLYLLHVGGELGVHGGLGSLAGGRCVGRGALRGLR